MLTLQCESCGTLRDMTDEQVLELTKTPRDIPKCPKDKGVMWPIGADNSSEKMKQACLDTAKKLRPKSTPMTTKDRALIERIENHIGRTRIMTLADEISANTAEDGYGESVAPSLAATILTFVLFRLMTEEKIALITRDK